MISSYSYTAGQIWPVGLSLTHVVQDNDVVRPLNQFTEVVFLNFEGMNANIILGVIH